jgi:hypothetical protein
MSGRWAQKSHFLPKFFIPGFVKQDTLRDILPYLPSPESVSPDRQDKLQEFQRSVPRDVGKNILDKLLKFWNEANSAFLTAAAQMESIHQKVAHATQIRYATLEEIAEKCLVGGIAKDKDGNFHQSTLYALHRRILESDVEIRAQQKGTLRAGGEYEIASLLEVEDIRKVEALVREYVEQRMTGHKSVPLNPVQRFAQSCRISIDASRQRQKFTRYGMIGPPPDENISGSACLPRLPLTTSRLFLRFMESWCGLQSFSRGSTLHGIGSTLLRAIDRYNDVELDMRTAWTFLQEVNIIPFWETPHAYLLKLPDVGTRLRLNEPKAPTSGFGDDQQAAIRKQWGDLPVFCIDDVGAHEIDDGVSIEATENDGQYWVHVHVADPASHIDPNSPVAEYAQKFVTNVYLPDHVSSMLDPEYIQSNFSMGNGRPCLTFSAKLDVDGGMLDYKISAGHVNNVIYVTPSVLDEVGADTNHGSASEKDAYLAGDDALPTVTPSRGMTSASGLTASQRTDLRIMRGLGLLRSSYLKSKGGLDFASNNYNLAIHLDAPARLPKSENTSGLPISSARKWKGKPIVEVSKDRGLPTPNPLSYLMILAGQVCARWCHERGIPTIYRITPYNPSKETPADFFRRVVIPSRAADGNVPFNIVQEYLQLLGAAQPSTRAGPHVAVGADMFSKCTSPLRRYGDLLMHWQIGAALREEARLRRPLIGNTDESIFPFSTAQINRLLPRIDTRERASKKASVDARNSWFCQFFIRAWKFGEATLPDRLSFVVRRTDATSNTAVGIISQFDFPAILLFNDILKCDVVLPGQEIDVEVVDIDMPRGKIFLAPRTMEPLGGRRLDRFVKADDV